MHKIKILHILHAVGGVEVHLRLILRNLNSDLFEHIIVHGKKDTTKLFVDQQNTAVKEYQIAIDREINPVKDSRSFIKLHKIIDKEQPNLIHGHSAKGGFLAKFMGKKHQIPVLYTPHAYSFLSAQSKLKRNLFLKLESRLIKANNKILACSESEKNRAIQEVGYPPEKVLVYNNSIEDIRDLPKLSIPKTWPENYICSVGRPSYQKNIELMVEVIKTVKPSLPNIHLVLMGVGFHSPNLEKVKEQIKRYGLQDHITLLEWTKREDILNIIQAAQLYISTARYEGLPYSIIEAMALKKACIVSNADGNRDLVENGVNGYVINTNEPSDFAEKTIHLMEDQAARNKFGQASYQLFQEKYNIQNTVHILEEHYLNEAKA